MTVTHWLILLVNRLYKCAHAKGWRSNCPAHPEVLAPWSWWVFSCRISSFVIVFVLLFMTNSLHCACPKIYAGGPVPDYPWRKQSRCRRLRAVEGFGDKGVPSDPTLCPWILVKHHYIPTWSSKNFILEPPVDVTEDLRPLKRRLSLPQEILFLKDHWGRTVCAIRPLMDRYRYR